MDSFTSGLASRILLDMVWGGLALLAAFVLAPVLAFTVLFVVCFAGVVFATLFLIVLIGRLITGAFHG